MRFHLLIVNTTAGEVEVCQVWSRFEAMLLASDLNVKTPFIPVVLAPSWGNVGRLYKGNARIFAPSDILFQACIVQSVVVLI